MLLKSLWVAGEPLTLVRKKLKGAAAANLRWTMDWDELGWEPVAPDELVEGAAKMQIKHVLAQSICSFKQ